ncbi:hypothetical protein K2173_025490 [Erythroxylum novogranatense]|uniref:Interactor of constitutive active ROPs 4 n=1 Tax=Erythroxylum novogranatense TaxID=1862640 RepID=A0AAV8UDY0_9ROSI|nr:hypothetical protein K2173_025490 [Erythroxylum novogranatense]
MPKARGSEVPQRQSLRGPHPLRTSSSDSDPSNHRPITDRSPKLGDRRSPRGPQPDALNQKKLGSRIADLESQLGQAQEELKILKDQLASAEAAKKEAQQELEKKTKRPAVPEPRKVQEKHSPTEAHHSQEVNSKSAGCQQETDVFEVPVEKRTLDPDIELDHLIDHVKVGSNSIEISTAQPVDDEINKLKAKLEDKEKELELFGKENENLKNQLNEATSNISTAKAKEEEISSRMSQLSLELEESKESVAQLKEKLEAVEGAKEVFEVEMKKMRVQTEQWRKAADAAAAVLAGSAEMNGRISERCVSMDKHIGGIFQPSTGGYNGFVGSPGMADDMDDGFGSGKQRGSGIKRFGDLWKKKSQK